MAVHKPSVVVVGSGLGGVETAANLANHMDGEANIILVSESDDLELRPFLIYPAFSNIFKRRRMTHLPLANNAARRGIEYQTWHVDEVDTGRQQLRGAGRALDFDHLVIATGAGMYAQVPLAMSSEGDGKEIMRPGADDDYVVLRSRLWKMGKWGMYMTMVWQMGRMETFHEGPIWSAMDMAIGGMQKIPAPA